MIDEPGGIDTHRVMLSAAGEQRRAALRSELTSAVVRRRRVRRAAQGVCAAIAGLLLAVLVRQQFATTQRAPEGGPIARGPSRAGDGRPAALPLATEFVKTERDIVARCAVAEREPSAAIYVGDHELQDLLRSNGRAVDVVRMGEVVMVTGLVPDPWEGE